MNRVAIIGSQWGDEGKGKVVNYFSHDFEWTVRFSGGANAGHTIYYKDKKYVNHLLPSIDLSYKSKGFLGAGMVIDIEQLIEELEKLEKDFPNISSQFYIDPEAFIVLPWNKEEDYIIEGMRKNKIGTTGRGIGPTYTDKISRQGIKFYYLFDDNLLKERLEEIFYIKNKFYGNRIKNNSEKAYDYLIKLKEKLLKLNVNFMSVIDMMDVFKNTSVLFEGAQGVMLDLDFGTYPFVTSSSCTAYGISSVGFSRFELDEVYGVLKAYTTRVGEGPFPTELKGGMGEKIRLYGDEFGATTKRPRRTGWLDLPALRYAKIRSGITSFIMTKADILNGFDEVKVCVKYNVNGKIKDIPSTSYDFFKAEPIYESLKGWSDIEDINFLKYIAFIEQNTGINIKYISYGPKTKEMCYKEDIIMKM